MFWIKVDVHDNGRVSAGTYPGRIDPRCEGAIRVRWGNTVSQALRALAAAMVHAKAETIIEGKEK